MSNSREKDRAKPLSIRFTEAEKAILREKSASEPLGSYIRRVVLDDGNKVRAGRAPRPVQDGQALGQLLGLLGQSRIANNLNQLAKAANLGALPVLKDTEDDIREACAYVREMRALLLAALGLRIMDAVRTAPEAGNAFAVSAGDPAP